MLYHLLCFAFGVYVGQEFDIPSVKETSFEYYKKMSDARTYNKPEDPKTFSTLFW